MPDSDTPLNTAAEVLLAAQASLRADAFILWVEESGSLRTEGTTLPYAGGSNTVDMKVGEGVAGRSFAQEEVIIVPDFQNEEWLQSRDYTVSHPLLVRSRGWRSSIFVPITFPRKLAMIGGYSRTPDFFSNEHAEPVRVWGERALLRARFRLLSHRTMRIANIYESYAHHVHDVEEAADTALQAVLNARDKGGQQHINKALAEVRKVARLCKQDLKSVGQTTHKLAYSDISSVVHLAVDSIIVDANEEKVAVKRLIQPKCAGLIDQLTFQRAVFNLLQNSLHHLKLQKIPNKEIVVSVKYEGAFTKVVVGDNGPGIQEERKANIFEPGTTYRPHGFGHGLAQVRTVMDAIDGTIELTRNVWGKGCEFTLSIPRLAKGSSYGRHSLD